MTNNEKILKRALERVCFDLYRGYYANCLSCTARSICEIRKLTETDHDHCVPLIAKAYVQISTAEAKEAK